MQNRTSLTTLLAFLTFCGQAMPQTRSLAGPQAQITQAIEQRNTVTLAGNVHPLIAAASSSLEADADTPMQHMLLTLKGSAAQEAALDQLVAAQQDPKSPLYHQYLTPQSFASQFGAASSDIDKVIAWLESHGLHVEQVAAGNRALVFSGTASQVTETFQTEIRQYKVAGVNHLANATDPQIPAALANAVGGVVKLHDFRHSPKLGKLLPAINPSSPQWTNGSRHFLTPADYSTIYDINPLYSAGINGTGQTIAVIARSDISLSDVQTFRSTFGLKANDPQFIVTNSDPGQLSGDSTETILDTEWAGAVAPGATVKVIISSSGTSDGIDLSSLYAVNNNVAPIITLSYGSCELGMGTSELSFYNSLWKQAASQGQSVMVSAGDSGAAGCDNPGAESVASYGQNINGLCSSPYATCVGGTEFNDTSNPGQYWLPNNTSTFGSAISYIPEVVWNESAAVSGGSGLWAGGGGASIAYAKPSWQTGSGVPNDNRRDVPDVSMASAGHDGYLIAFQGNFYTVGGTSAAAPSFAGIIALLDQKMSARQGLLNPTLYPLAVKQLAAGAAVFHDITGGSNSVPGVTGFPATAGYDLSTGLGSVDANLLVNHWTDVSTTAPPSLALSASPASLNVLAGQTAQTAITATPGGSLKAAITFTITGAPTGLSATLASPSIAPPGSGTDVLKVVASSTLAPGTYNLTVSGTGAGVSANVLVAVVVPAPNFAISAGATSVSMTAGNASSVNLTLASQNGFSSAVALSLTGLPAGVTATFTPASITGASTSTLKLTSASTAAASTSTLTITGTSGSLKQTVNLSLVISVPSLAITASAASLTLPVSSSASLTISSNQTSLSSAVTLSITGLPTGVTTAFSPATLSASGSSTLTFTAGASVVAATYPLTITATGGGLTSKAAVSLVIPSSSFTLATGAASINILPGNTAQTSVTITPQKGFASNITLGVSGVPAGVTGTFAPVTGGASGAFALTLLVNAQTNPGSYPLTVSAAGGGITKTAALTLVVTTPPSCAAVTNPSSINMKAGLTTTVQLSCSAPTGSFTAPLALTVSGAPAGMTTQFAAATLTPGSAVNLSVHTLETFAGGSYTLAVTLSGSGFNRTLTLPVTILAQNTIMLTASQMQLYMQPGASSQVTLTTLALGGFSSPVAFSSSLPTPTSGLAVTLSKTSLPAPGSGTVVATIAAASNLPAGNYVVQLTLTGGNCDGATCNESAYIGVQISSGPGFSFSVNPSALTINQGSTGSLTTFSGNYVGGFNGQMSVTLTGFPFGVSYGAIGSNNANNMVGTIMGITVPSSVPLGTYPITITATGSGITHTVTLPLTISK